MSCMLVALLLVSTTGHVFAQRLSSAEKALRDKLFDPAHYDKAARPVIDHSKPVNVSFALSLSKLVELNTKHQLLVIDSWIIQRWTNPYLAWNESEHKGIHTLHVPATSMWVPDTVLYDNGDDEVSQAGFTEKFKTFVMLESNGLCSWMAPSTFKSSCDIDVTNFPFDTQSCSMTFGSWTYDDRLLSIKQLHGKHSQAERYVANGDWKVLDVDISNPRKNYTCCTYPFSSVVYTFSLERKPAYHVLYLVVPCIIISCLSVLSFFLPPDCGERIGLSITILLAMAVYLLIVSDILPETSDHIPRLGLYYMIVMGLLAMVVAATGIVLRCHFSRSKPPNIIARFRRANRSRVDAKTSNSKTTLSLVTLDGNPPATQSKPTENGKIQQSPDEDVAKPPTEDEKELWEECWKDFARRLDIIFLILFAILFIITTFATLFSRKPHNPPK